MRTLALLDGCDDDDVVRPELVLRAINQAWSPKTVVDWPEMTARELRERIAAARLGLAKGEKIP
jgi:hypothetical protein